jgi:hypothetical protein
MWTSTDPLIRLLDALLLISFLISATYAGWHYYRHSRWNLSRAIILGFSLPLALLYTAALLIPPKPSLSWSDNAARQLTVILFSVPQIVLLYPIGVLAWIHPLKSLRSEKVILLLVLTVVIVGHIWTRTFLAAL